MKRVLFLGAHCDDIELGCGGTIHKHREDWEMHAAVFSVINPARQPVLACCRAAMNPFIPDLTIYNYTTREFAKERNSIWERCDQLAQKIQPDLVFTNGPHDTHQDHKALFDEVMRKTFKCSIACYYTFTSTSRPNYYELLDSADVDAKLKMLREYEMYQDKPYFHTSYVTNRLAVNGYEIGHETKYAEAFEIERLIQ